MKTVSLPIYENGIELNERLEIEVALFERVARNLRVSSSQIKIVPGPTVEQEIEVLDRIIHNLPPRPESNDPRGWRTIEGFSGYIINARGMIIDKQTQKTVATEVKFDRRRAMLCDDNNSMKWMNVEWLMFKTFPELTN